MGINDNLQDRNQKFIWVCFLPARSLFSRFHFPILSFSSPFPLVAERSLKSSRGSGSVVSISVIRDGTPAENAFS